MHGLNQATRIHNPACETSSTSFTGEHPMSTPSKRPKLNQAWADLFAENEARVKAGDKPWTDDQLRERMQKEFPDKAEKSTIVRVSMVRSVYNKGTNMFKKHGPAGAKGRPVSKCYNPDGVERRNARTLAPRKAVAAARENGNRVKATGELCRIILWVRDPVSLSDWYRMALGWPIAVDERAEGWIELDAGGGMRLALHAGNVERGGHWPKIQVRVEDVAAERAALMARGVHMGAIKRWKYLTWSEGEDPEGNVFQVVNR